MRRAAVVLYLLLAAASVAAAPVERAFKLTYRSAAEAVALVAPLLSASGSVVLQPQDNTLLVRDSAENVDRIGATLRRWDVAPATFRVEIRLVRASDTLPTPAPGPHFAPEVQEVVAATPTPFGPHIRTLEDDLRKLFKYSYFDEIGVLRMATTDGATVEHPIAGRYAVRFTLRTLPPTYSRVQLTGFELLHRGGRDGEDDDRRPVFVGNINLGIRQVAVIAAAPSESSTEALLLAFRIERERSE